MSEGHSRWWHAEWSDGAEFEVPSLDLGIAFTVELRISGKRPWRMTEHRAKALALGIALRAVSAAAREYSVLHADAATLAATAACLASRLPWRGLTIDHISQLELSAEPHQESEARRLAILRRTAKLAGAQAINDAAKAEALGQIVLSDHTNTIAHLLLNPTQELEKRNLPEEAAKLRRHIDDYQPDSKWIRVAETLNVVLDKKRHHPEQIRSMLENLAKWAGHYSTPLKNSIEDTMPVDESTADETRGETPPDPGAG